MSWLEDFADGEAVWKKLLAAPSIATFFEQAEALTEWERKKVLLYHAIRDKQAAGEWGSWSGVRVSSAEPLKGHSPTLAQPTELPGVEAKSSSI
jgi:hypothetical protein